jgi:hypothetical protein
VAVFFRRPNRRRLRDAGENHADGSPYLVREAELRIDGNGQTTQRVVASRVLKVGPLFPGVYVHEEVGIGAREGISGLAFNSVAAHAARLTPPSGMMPAAEYPALVVDIVDVTVDEDAPDLRRCESEGSGQPPTAAGTAIHIRVRNNGPAVVERARIKLQYFEPRCEESGGDTRRQREVVAEWILDMPRQDWNPYQLPAAPNVSCAPADPMLAGQVHEFTLMHYAGGPNCWAGCRDAVSGQYAS